MIQRRLLPGFEGRTEGDIEVRGVRDNLYGVGEV